MLLVILGAGASYDSLPKGVRRGIAQPDVDQFRPPLAQQLIQDRTSFSEVLYRYPQCVALAHQLKKDLSAGGTLEEQLEKYQEEAREYPPMSRQLMALRFYLQEILWICGERWQALSHGETNFAELLFRLDKWRHRKEESLCFVTFNYDLLLDRAAMGTLSADLSSVESYAADERYRFLKLHGSVNWGRRVRSPGGVHYSKADHARKILIDAAADLSITDDFVVRTPDDSPSDASPYASILMPAITIPVQAKSHFECPASHLAALEACVKETSRILVIGWRGMEKHFLEKLDSLPGKAPAISIVGGDDDGTQQTATNLSAIGLAADKMHRFNGGFAEYLETDLLEEFLNADVAGWTQEG